MATLLVGAGAVFKLQHWPYAMIMIYGGLGCIAVWFIFTFIIKDKAKEESFPDILDQNDDSHEPGQ